MRVYFSGDFSEMRRRIASHVTERQTGIEEIDTADSMKD